MPYLPYITLTRRVGGFRRRFPKFWSQISGRPRRTDFAPTLKTMQPLSRRNRLGRPDKGWHRALVVSDHLGDTNYPKSCSTSIGQSDRVVIDVGQKLILHLGITFCNCRVFCGDLDALQTLELLKVYQRASVMGVSLNLMLIPPCLPGQTFVSFTCDILKQAIQLRKNLPRLDAHLPDNPLHDLRFQFVNPVLSKN